MIHHTKNLKNIRIMNSDIIKNRSLYSSLLIFISAILILVQSGCEALRDEDTEVRHKPNIIFLVSEDNSAFLGSYGDSLAYTPNLDRFADSGIVYKNAFANAPVCAPARSSLITGMYANSLGSHHMRSLVEIPEDFRFFPHYLRDAGYYTVNRIKKDYNIFDQDGIWDNDEWWNYPDMLKDREEGQPFFVMYNTWMSHEDKLHGSREERMLEYYINSSIQPMTGEPASQERVNYFNHMHDPASMQLPPYHPDTPEMREDWARYYDAMSMMDDEIGEFLNNLERDGLLDNTIVFYFSDHGGVLGRSKRFTFESGLHVPFIVHVPEKYQHMVHDEPGSRTARVISFVDLAPTVMNLAGLEIPEHFQGEPFLGPNSGNGKEFAFGFRGRMDERYDLSLTVRNKDYRYIRNYMPHWPWAQRVNYLWRAESMKSWEQAYKDGRTDEYQSRFWEPKPAEELYSIHDDPHNVNNLASEQDYRHVLEEMRNAMEEWVFRTNSKSFIPEGEYLKALGENIGYEYFTGRNYDLGHIYEIASLATLGDPVHLPELENALLHEDSIIRYWGAVGARILGNESEELEDLLIRNLEYESLDVRIASAEALYFLGHRKEVFATLKEILQNREFEPFGPMEAIRTHALNAVDVMQPEDKLQFKEEIEAIASREGNGYDKRVAEYLLTQLGF